MARRLRYRSGAAPLRTVILWVFASLLVVAAAAGLLPSQPAPCSPAREKWTHQIVIAKQQGRPRYSNALTPMQSAALTMQERATRYTERMAGVSERLLPHLETMLPGEILERARNVEQFDRFSRRNFGLDLEPPGGCPINLAVLTNRAAIQIIAPESVRPIDSDSVALSARAVDCIQAGLTEMQSQAVIGERPRLSAPLVDCLAGRFCVTESFE